MGRPEEVENLLKNEIMQDERLFSSVIENLNIGVVLIDDKGKFILYNNRFLELLGIPHGSPIRNVNDQNWSKWQVLDEQSGLLPVDEHPVRKAAITGKKVTNQLVGVKNPGADSITWMLVSADPVVNEYGKIEKTVCTYLDVTSQMLSNIALQKSEAQYRALVTASSEVLYRMNPDWSEMLQLSSRGFLTNTMVADRNWIHNYIPAEDQAFVMATINKAIRHKSTFKLEHRVIMMDGSFGWAFSRAIPILDTKGNITEWFGSAIDITRQKEAERALLESENRLREMNETKDKLFSIIYHDLKSPFTSIIGFSELLVDKIQRNDREDIDTYAKMIRDSSWSAMDLLSNLIEWSRIRMGRMEFKPVASDLISIITEQIGLLRVSAQKKSIEISLRMPEKLEVLADKVMIGTVVRNLISNAIKFTNTGGQIIISGYQEKRNVRVEVIDNGIGMDEEAVKKIFSAPDGISTPGTQNELGTGLGMIICKEFILRHGGEIWAESELNKGSKFIFTLPAAL